MSLLEVRTIDNAKMVINTDNIISLVDETNVKGHLPKMGKSVLFLFGGLSVRTNVEYSEIRRVLDKEKIIKSLVEEVADVKENKELSE